MLPALLIALGWSSLAGAQSLYAVEVELDNEASQPRTAAYETALLAVLTRVTGSELSGDPLLVRELFPDPAAYVTQFRPGEADTLWVSFDGEAIEETLRRSGQLVWGEERPSTLVWLAVDWGDGVRELIAADGANDTPPEGDGPSRQQILREQVLDAAERRGLPVLFPLLDIEDLSAVSFADLWGGFDEPVIDASARYNVESVLIGRIRADGLSVGRWTHYLGDQMVSWGGNSADVVNLLADQLASEFAIGGDAPLRSVELSVAGITSVESYARLQKIIDEVVVIDRASLTRVEGDRVHYRVTAYGGASRLARALRLKGLLEEERIDFLGDTFGAEPESLSFFFGP